VAQISSWGYIAQDEVAIAQAIANNGPVAVAIYVNNNFQLYK
jgi:Papain family cysteine protease